MTKFLRKYNKLILVIGGSLLMIAFLMPEALQRLGQDQSGREYMRIDGRKVTNADAGRAAAYMYVIRELMPNEMARLGIENRTDHWLLLMHEARLQGLVGGPQDGRDYFRDYVESQINQQLAQQMFMIPPEQREQLRATFTDNMELAKNRLAAATNLPPGEIDQGMAELRAIERLRIVHYGSTMRVSDRRTVQLGRDRLDRATVDYVFLPPDLAADRVQDPDDAALAAHVERFRDVRPNDGEYGIGYLLPPRLKLEWLALDRAAIEATVRLDRVEVMQRFLRENPGQEGSAAFEQARPAIEAQLRKEAVDRIVSEADKIIRAEFARATRRLDRQGDFRVLPADWNQQKPDLHAIRDVVVERVRAQLGYTIPAPTVTVRAADWLTADDLRTLPGIGASFVQRGNQRLPFAQAALSVKELAGTNDIGLQVGVPGVVSRDMMGNEFYFTILEARAESAPESLEEVRARALRDYRRLRAYELIRADADAYLQRALSEGLRDLALAKPLYPGGPLGAAAGIFRENVQVSRPGPVTESMSFERSYLDYEPVRNAIMAAAERLDPTIDLTTVDAASRTITVPVPSRLGVAVVQVKAFRPMTLERYRTMDGNLARELLMQHIRELKEDPFSVDRLAARHNAKLPARGSDDES